MTHRYDIQKMLLDAVGYRGAFYPGVINAPKGQIDKGGSYNVSSHRAEPKMRTSTGSPLRAAGVRMGSLYFMPVMIGDIEMPNAVISITGKKTIIETPMVGRAGSVKELISIDDYEINLTGVLVGKNREYPEDLVASMRDLWKRNQSVKLISALTDLVMENNDKVVIKTIDFPAVGAIEDAQVVKLTATSDIPFELEIE